MDRPVVLFGEGITDEKFLIDFIKYHFGIENIKYVNVEGKDRIHKVRNNFEMNTDQGGVNLLIFDADSDFQTALENINRQKEKLGIDFEVFLFPNNSDSGAIEELLFKLSVEKHRVIFDCFEPFNYCLTQRDMGYHVPDLKTQIYSYLAFQIHDPRDGYRDYTLDCWNLDSEYANPLKEFLKNYLG